MSLRNFLFKLANPAKVYGPRVRLLGRHDPKPQLSILREASESSAPAVTSGPKRMSAAGGLREFLMHPLTWDRNNGYFNILVGLAIFGYCFCTSCHTERSDKMVFKDKK